MLLPDWSPLRSRDFRLLYFGQLISAFGSALTYVVLPIQMYELTRSTVMVGLLGVAEFVPMIVVAFAGGLFVDRADRRKLILTAEALMAACLLGLVANAWSARPLVWPLFVAAGVLAALNAVNRPATEGLKQQLLSANQMAAAAALAMLPTIAFIAGPGLAGWIAIRFGVATAFELDVASYAICFAAVLAMRTGPMRGGEEDVSWHTLVEGWRYALKRRDLLGTYLIDLNAMFFGMPNALFPAFGAIYGTANVGLLYAAGPVGAFLSGLASRPAQRIERHGLAIAIAATVWGAGIAGFGLSRSLIWALLFLAVAGAADGVSGIFRMTMWNQTIQQNLRGRMAAIELVSYTSGPYLGNAEAGFAARILGLGPSVVLGGVICMAGSGIITLWLREFREYRAPPLSPNP